MNNTTPQLRADHTGKLVTRHVRTDPTKPSKRPVLPAPALVSGTGAKPAQNVFKPRPKQLEVVRHSFKADFLSRSSELCDSAEQDRLREANATYSFEASPVEMYAVLGTVELQGDAVIMLADGVRSANEAQQWLSDHGAEHLIIDRSEQMQEALEKNLHPSDFIKHSRFPDRWGTRIDATLFFHSSLNRGPNGLVINDIVTGAISYDDIKFLGTTKLKANQRLFSMQDMLKQVRRGEITIDQVKDLLDRSNDEGLNAGAFTYIAEVVKERGIAVLSEFKRLMTLQEAYSAYHFPYNLAQRYGDTKMDRTIYRARLMDGLDVTHYVSDKEFYDAGIPVEIAVKAIANGGGLLQAQAIHDEGINENLAEGWL